MEDNNNPAIIKAEEKKKEGRKFCFVTETAKQIQQSAPPKRIYLIDGIITPGLNILAAPRKKGKSWLALDIALCVDGKEDFWGRKTEHGKVLYFALEDHRSRMKQRIDTILDDEDFLCIYYPHTVHNTKWLTSIAYLSFAQNRFNVNVVTTVIYWTILNINI